MKVSRKERKEKATLKRAEIEKEIFDIMSKVIDVEQMKGSIGHIQLEAALKEGDRFINLKIRENPREAHMVKQAAISVKTKINNFLKGVENGKNKSK